MSDFPDPPAVTAIDHLVLTVSSVAAAAAFYERALGVTAERFEGGDGGMRTALRFGKQKINLHEAGREFAPHSARPTPGSGDLCFLTDRPLQEWLSHLSALDVPLREGPVRRTGARGPMTSIYVDDPDGNLVEIARYG